MVISDHYNESSSVYEQVDMVVVAQGGFYYYASGDHKNIYYWPVRSRCYHRDLSVDWEITCIEKRQRASVPRDKA